MTFLGDRVGTVLSNVNNQIQGQRDKLDVLEIGDEDLGVLKYPLDSDRLSGHFIMFHIVETTPGSGTIPTNGDAQAIGLGLAAAGGTGAIPGPVAKAADDFVNRVENLGKVASIISRGRKRIDATRKALIDKGVSSEALTRFSQLPVTVETVGTVVIYMPEKLSTGYSFEYQGAELRIAAAGIGLVNLAKTLIGRSTVTAEQTDFIKSLGQEFGLRLGATLIDQLGSLVGADIGGAAAVEKTNRRVTNPHMQFLFRSVNQRSFEYTFHFIPQSREETEAIDNIIRTFKFFSHPELLAGGRFHAFPAEFDIQYISREQDPKNGKFIDQENDWLNRVGRCYLKDIAVDYSGSGVFSTHKNHSSPLPETLQSDVPLVRGGHPPTHITVTLTFQELETLNRQHILEGF